MSADVAQGAPRLTRDRDRRVVAGVCAGLPPIAGLGVNGLRALFTVLALLGGIGVIVYLACWLIIPADTGDLDADRVPTVVLLAWGAGGLAVFVLVAAASATAAVFGLGWVMVGVAVLVLVAAALVSRLPATVAMLAVAALSLPAAAVALSPIHVGLQDGPQVTSPRTLAAVSGPFTAGFGTRMIALKQTPWPASGNVTMHLSGGVRRTVVVLPSRECVHVRINYEIHPFLSRLATLVLGRYQPPFGGVVLFGRVYGLRGNSGFAQSRGDQSGPTLTIDYTSQGGSLYVRDYPDLTTAFSEPQWPGYKVTPEPRPYLGGEPKKVAKAMLASWHRRRAAEVANARTINGLLGGPCSS